MFHFLFLITMIIPSSSFTHGFRSSPHYRHYYHHLRYRYQFICLVHYCFILLLLFGIFVLQLLLDASARVRIDILQRLHLLYGPLTEV